MLFGGMRNELQPFISVVMSVSTARCICAKRGEHSFTGAVALEFVVIDDGPLTI